MEKGRISSFQMACMIVPTIIATAILIVPAITGKFAGRDMWISSTLASVNGFFTVFILYRLHRIFPNKTFVQYSECIIGRIPGKILGFAYLLFFLHVAGSICREYADFVIGSFLPKTPMIVVLGSIVIICAFAIRGGVEVLGRAAQLLVPLFILPLFLLILILPELKVVNIFPIMEHGVMPVIMGAAVPQGWFAEVFMISMLLPYVADRQKGMKWSIISVIVAMLLLTYTNIISIFHFGESVTSYSYPVFSVFRYISFGSFFEHLESVVITFWILGIFVKISVFYYALTLGIAQWLQCYEYRPIVFPVGFLLTLFGMWVASSEQEMTQFLGNVFPFYGFLMLTLIPTILLVITILQKKWKRKSDSIKD